MSGRRWGRIWMFKAVEILPVLGPTSQYVLFQADGPAEKDEDLVRAAILHLKGVFQKRGKLIKLPFGLGENMAAWPCDPKIPIRPGLCPIHWELSVPLKSGQIRHLLIRVDSASLRILSEAVEGVLHELSGKTMGGYALTPVAYYRPNEALTEEKLILAPPAGGV